MTDSSKAEKETGQHNFAVDLAHDFGGAILFSFPLLMTMEMWWLGFYMDRFRLALFIALMFLIVMGLSYFEGGEETIKIEVLDSLVACAVGYTVAALMLVLFGILGKGMSISEIVGKICLQAIPCSLGAILARRQLDVQETRKEQRRREGYMAKIFLALVGAIFLAFQLAPTEEMILIGHRMTGWHAAALVILSILIMQAFLYSIERQKDSNFSARFFRDIFFRFTIIGYSLALLISLYVLWTFGRLDGASISEIVMSTIVLGFPAALGASVARLIL